MSAALRVTVLVGLFAAALAAYLYFQNRLAEEAAREPQAPAAVAEAAPEPAREPVASAPGGEAAPATPELPEAPSIPSGGRIELEASAFEPGRPVELSLLYPVAPGSDAPVPARILAVEDGRLLELEAGIRDARDGASVAIDPEWLVPGRYLVEIRTREKSALPLRRYVVVVR